MARRIDKIDKVIFLDHLAICRRFSPRQLVRKELQSIPDSLLRIVL